MGIRPRRGKGDGEGLEVDIGCAWMLQLEIFMVQHGKLSIS